MIKTIRTKWIILLLALLPSISFAQVGRNKPIPASSIKKNTFLETQWWLGIRGGFNLSAVTVNSRYSVIEPIDYNAILLSKDYQNYNRLGNQVGLDVSFYYKGFYICFQPGYRHTRISYQNEYFWFDRDNPGTEIELKYEHENRLDHLEIPLIIKYDIMGNKLRPFLQAGIFNAYLINANKTLDISGIDRASGGTNEFKTGTISTGASQLFNRSYWGLIGGAGLHYQVGNIRLVLDASYRHGMSDVTRASARFGSDSFAGVGEAQDDLSLNNITLSLGCIFPLKFLSSNFKSMDLTK